MRGRALLMTAMTLALGAGAAAAREPELNPGGASDEDTKASFDLVGAAFAPISTLASPYSYITNPVCLFATTGETCSEASGPLYLSLPYGETLRQVPITLTFEYEGRIERLIGLRVRVTGPNIDRPSENIIGNNLSITSAETPSGRTRVEISNFYIPPMQLDPFDGEITLAIEVTAKVGESEVRDTALVRVGDQNPATFVPTFSTNRLSPGNARFSGRDPDVGYDFWSTFETIEWLRSRSNLWVNDFSAMHSARYGQAGRSILDHETHHDGRTIDLRYASGLTDDDEPLLDNECFSGRPCKKTDSILFTIEMAAEAATEDINKLPERQEARDRTQEWIEANRELFASVSGDAEIIYVGRGPIYDALVLGMNAGHRILTAWAPGNPTYMQAWVRPPPAVRSARKHDDHWHLVLRNPG